MGIVPPRLPLWIRLTMAEYIFNLIDLEKWIVEYLNHCNSGR